MYVVDSVVSSMFLSTGEGSLFALLKKIGWASSLVAGESSLSLSSTSFFYVKVGHRVPCV